MPAKVALLPNAFTIHAQGQHIHDKAFRILLTKGLRWYRQTPECYVPEDDGSFRAGGISSEHPCKREQNKLYKAVGNLHVAD